ncbi:Uncharacterised protein [uncultured archaeon]|nr:Uncharacterised protein [uncultured archaeon]
MFKFVYCRLNLKKLKYFCNYFKNGLYEDEICIIILKISLIPCKTYIHQYLNYLNCFRLYNILSFFLIVIEKVSQKEIEKMTDYLTELTKILT